MHSCAISGTRRKSRSGICSVAISAAAPAIRRSLSRPSRLPPSWHQRIQRSKTAMFDLGTSLIASVARDPDAIAVVDAEMRLTYREWYGKISALVAGFDQLGLTAGDHILTALQNRWEAATLHWACQLAGLVITPINWRAKADEMDFYLTDARARAIVYQDISAEAVDASTVATGLCRIGVGLSGIGDAASFAEMISEQTGGVAPRVSADAWSIILYTSGTTSRPKGVPRRHRAERAAGVAHVAQNMYGRGERTLGVMPLYHTMGVRSLIAMSLIGGTFVCLPRYDSAG